MLLKQHKTEADSLGKIPKWKCYGVLVFFKQTLYSTCPIHSFQQLYLLTLSTEYHNDMGLMYIVIKCVEMQG